jgi:hypothetical protein
MANGAIAGAQEDDGDASAEAGKGGTSVLLSIQPGICMCAEKVRGDVTAEELKTKVSGSARFGCVYREVVSAHEVEKENGLNGETSPEEA